MSKIAFALVGLAHAVSSAATFPHQPVPTSFRDRIVSAAQAVEAAATGDDALAGPGEAPDFGVLISAILANDEFRIALIDAVIARIEPNLTDMLPSKPAFVDAVAKKVEKDVTKAVEKESAKASNALHGRVGKLEEFAEKVDSDVAERLAAIEKALAADPKSGEGSASGDEA